MQIMIWKQMSWSMYAKKPGWVMFNLVADHDKWRVVDAGLYTGEREYVGKWFRTSMPLNVIRNVEQQALKMHGRPTRRGPGGIDPVTR